MKSQQLRSLPEEIISTEILPRLYSVKSLLRFKCVSKSWCSLIYSNEFAKKQLQYSAQNAPLNNQNAIIVSRDLHEYFSVNHCLASLFSLSSISVDQFESRNWMRGLIPFLVGCCNGLCCVLEDSTQFILWNPSTRVSRILPSVPSVLNNKFATVKIHGFGYDESKDDYKVVAVLETYTKHVREHVLYSLKTNSWKTINDSFHHHRFGGREYMGGKGALLNGKLHWMSDNYSSIVSYDLGMEAAGVVELPSFKNYPCQRMGVIKGCLCVVMCVNMLTSEKGMEVWVMKEYGVKESWCKVFTLPIHNHPVPLCISEDCVVIKDDDYESESSLLIYSPKKKSKMVSHLKVKVTNLIEVDFCIQTLVSPFRDVKLAE